MASSQDIPFAFNNDPRYKFEDPNAYYTIGDELGRYLSLLSLGLPHELSA